MRIDQIHSFFPMNSLYFSKYDNFSEASNLSCQAYFLCWQTCLLQLVQRLRRSMSCTSRGLFLGLFQSSAFFKVCLEVWKEGTEEFSKIFELSRYRRKSGGRISVSSSRNDSCLYPCRVRIRACILSTSGLREGKLTGP